MDITGIKRQIFCRNRERYTVQLLDLPGFSIYMQLLGPLQHASAMHYSVG